MRDLEKSAQVKRLSEAILDTAISYENDSHAIYFCYDSVIALLEQAAALINESARCPRPAHLSPAIPWCERLTDGDEVFDPYVFDGTMSLEDYELMHRLMAADRENAE